MIAIPVDSASLEAKSSKLFGNVSAFALYNSSKQTFQFVPNNGKGDGVATAKLLADLSVKSVVYSYMGDGPFGFLEHEGIGVFYLGKESLELPDIIAGLEAESFVKVDGGNSKTYLDPGTASGTCGCGCSHD
jgi:predicted Fe-Mo cluster-binding NifX family protein